MVWDMLQVIVLTVTFLYVYFKAPTARVRRYAWMPLLAALLELSAVGLFNAITFWPLTLLLVAARAALVWGCVGAVKQARRRMRQQRRRRMAAVTPIASAPVCRLQRHCA